MDNEISTVYCLGATFRCTPYEASGVWSLILFYSTVLTVTAVHGCLQEPPNDRHTTAHSQNHRSPTEQQTRDLKMVCSLVIYFFSLAAGSLLWVLVGVKAVHPVQSMVVQAIGFTILLTCIVVFLVVHSSLGENWTPAGQSCRTRKLVTGGVYNWCRHPMYSCFLWANIGTLLATLNWVITLCAMPVLVTLVAIEAEEQVLVERFGSQYVEYCEKVSALGFPWCCLGFDGGRGKREMRLPRGGDGGDGDDSDMEGIDSKLID